MKRLCFVALVMLFVAACGGSDGDPVEQCLRFETDGKVIPECYDCHYHQYDAQALEGPTIDFDR